MIFLDTSVIAASQNVRDQSHPQSTGMLTRINGIQKFVSDYIFDECVTLSMAKGGKDPAIRVGTALLEGDLRILKVTDDVFQRAWKLFQKNNGFSFTDCTTIVLMERFHIKKIATFDGEFKKLKGIEVIDR